MRCRCASRSCRARSAHQFGAAIFGHYGDRTGRKATLVPDLAEEDEARERRTGPRMEPSRPQRPVAPS